MAQPFHAKTLQPHGELFPVAEQVAAGFAMAPVSVSENGVLVYHAGRSLGENQLTWYDRSGKPLGKVGTPGRTSQLALSPDEKWVALPRYAVTGATSDIWLHELARGADTRFTFHASTHVDLVWSPNGVRLFFLPEGRHRGRAGRAPGPVAVNQGRDGLLPRRTFPSGSSGEFVGESVGANPPASCGGFAPASR